MTTSISYANHTFPKTRPARPQITQYAPTHLTFGSCTTHARPPPPSHSLPPARPRAVTLNPGLSTSIRQGSPYGSTKLVPRQSISSIEHRGSFVALGAALHNARIAAAHRNILGATEVSGDGTATTARIAFATGTDQQLAAQLPGMLNRVTHRGAPDTDPTSTNLTDLTDLAACLSTETHRIHLIEDRDTIDRLAETISATDRIRFLTDHLHREMIAELRWPDSNDLDTGIEVTSLGTPAAELAVLELLRRPDVMTHLNQWNTGQALRSETTSRLTSSNAIAVVTQTGTSAGDYIRGGALAEEFWIHTQSLGYSVHPMTPLPLYATAEHQLRHLSTDRIDELMTLWNELKTLTATTANNPATLILRIFRTTTPAPTSRRRTPHH